MHRNYPIVTCLEVAVLAQKKKMIQANLLKNSAAAYFAAVEIHNKPNIPYRYETVTLLIKGAPEVIISKCKDVDESSELARIKEYQQKGMRSLAFAKVELSKLDRIVLLCGHYEGIDERIIELEIDEVVGKKMLAKEIEAEEKALTEK